MGQILSENNNSARTNLDRKNPMLRSFVLDNIYAPIENCTKENVTKNRDSVNFNPNPTSMLVSGSHTRPYSISGRYSKDRNDAFSNDPISRYDDSSFPKSISSKEKYEQDQNSFIMHQS